MCSGNKREDWGHSTKIEWHLTQVWYMESKLRLIEWVIDSIRKKQQGFSIFIDIVIQLISIMDIDDAKQCFINNVITCMWKKVWMEKVLH